MSFLSTFLQRLRKQETTTSVPSSGPGPVNVPTGPESIPDQWVNTLFGPGRPLPPAFVQSHRGVVAEQEPRSFQYVPNINATISPRVAYGLMPFSQLKLFGESIPEVAMCLRLLTEELKVFNPQIKDEDDDPCPVDELAWMTTTPDHYTPWPVWLSRFLYNVLVYDAAAVFRVRDASGKITGLRIVDGSTLFVLIDERGEQPAPPAPAYTQIIYGMPRMWLTTEQIWYQPRQLRADSPYGRTPVEDALSAVTLLQNLWEYEKAWYTEGTMPEMFLAAPPSWTPEQVIDWERAYNARMAGNNADRRRIRVIPNGFTAVQTKVADWRKDVYSTALERVALAFGIPPMELGKVPGQGLGGAGLARKTESSFYRMGIGPLKEYVESLFNSILREMGYGKYHWELGFATDELDLQARRAQAIEEWNAGLISRDESRMFVGKKAVGGDFGASYLIPAGRQLATGAEGAALRPDGMPMEPGGPFGGVDQRPAAAATPAGEAGLYQNMWKAFDFRKHCGVCPEDDRYYGAPVVAPANVHFPQQGANESLIVSLTPAEGEARPGLFKPEGGEMTELQEWAGGPQSPREEVAYLVDRSLKFYLVPVAYVTQVGDQKGAVVHYVRGIQPREDVNQYAASWVQRAAVEDSILGQLDRGAHNWATHPEDDTRPILFDNGLTCPVDNHPVRSAFVEAWQGKALDADVVEALHYFLADRPTAEQIGHLVGDKAASKLYARAATLAALRAIPQPAAVDAAGEIAGGVDGWDAVVGGDYDSMTTGADGEA